MNITITVHSINDKHNFTNVVFIHHLSILSMCSANKGVSKMTSSKPWEGVGKKKMDDKGV